MSDAREHVEVREDERPVPIRYWWLKRLALAGAVMVLGLLALRIWWGYEAQRRLDEVIAGYRAAGQMVDAAEFDAVLDAVPDEDNAAILYEAAMGKLVEKTASGVRFYEFRLDNTLFNKKPVEAAELYSLNAESLKLIRQGHLRSQVAWSDRHEDFWRDNRSDLHDRQSYLNEYLRFATQYQIHRGEYGKAVEILRDMWIISDAVIDHPTMKSFLYGMNFQNRVIDSIEEMMGLISKTGMNLDEHLNQQIRELIQIAQQENNFIESSADSYSSALAAVLYILKHPIVDPVWPRTFGRFLPVVAPILNFVGRPAVVLDALGSVDYNNRVARAIRAKTWRNALGHVPVDNYRRNTNIAAALAHPYFNTRIVTEALSAKINALFFYNLLARRRAALAALAVKLFEIERGRWPGSLDELVPDYLSAVPCDPFGAEGDQLKYIVEDGRVVVYSVGLDGLDNEGELWDRKAQRGDRTFHLVGRPED